MRSDQERNPDEDTDFVCRFISNRQQNPRGPQAIADVMSSLLARRGYAQQRSSADCTNAWQQAVGERRAADSRAGSVRRGQLEVIVRSSSVLQELTFEKAKILKKLATLLPNQKIKDIRFRIGPLE